MDPTRFLLKVKKREKPVEIVWSQRGFCKNDWDEMLRQYRSTSAYSTTATLTSSVYTIPSYWLSPT